MSQRVRLTIARSQMQSPILAIGLTIGVIRNRPIHDEPDSVSQRSAPSRTIAKCHDDERQTDRSGDRHNRATDRCGDRQNRRMTIGLAIGRGASKRA